MYIYVGHELTYTDIEALQAMLIVVNITFCSLQRTVSVIFGSLLGYWPDIRNAFLCKITIISDIILVSGHVR